MTRELLNTLYVMKPHSYVRLDHETLRVECDGEKLAEVPLHHLGAVVLFDAASISPQAMERCAMDGREVVLLDASGRFRCRIEGPVSGNVLLRKAQYDAHNDPQRSSRIARRLVAGKIQNCRNLVMRGARTTKDPGTEQALRACAGEMARHLSQLASTDDIDMVRGIEGQAASCYFGVFGKLITVDGGEFRFSARTRRPPRDRLNALLSFTYALLCTDCTSAAAGVGLDPQLGYLHGIRPGRPALALDLMEELRPCMCDRLVLNLVNRRQVRAEHFEERVGHSVLLNEAGRRIVVVEYQRRKQEEIRHPLLKEKVPLGLVPHIQARLLARHLREDSPEYPPFIMEI
ncbi:MAG: type I-C CRISPR-associated endonuclease Cas1c [Candidatus Methanomethyliaceae archaeon]